MPCLQVGLMHRRVGDLPPNCNSVVICRQRILIPPCRPARRAPTG